MAHLKSEIPEKLKLLRTTHSKIKADQIPTLIPEKKMNILLEENENPYFAIEEILDITEPVFPTMNMWSPVGVTFTKKFWDSYLVKIKKRPLPGSKDGHKSLYDPGTPATDIYTVGGKREGNKVWLKIYIPTMGANSSNEGLIRDAKVGILHFSIVSQTKDVIELNENGEITKFLAVESVSGERNDVVEYDQGAMEQKVSQKDENHEKQNSQRSYIMADNVYKEIIENIKNQMANGAISIVQLSKDLGFKIVNDEIQAERQMLTDIKKLTGDNPLEKIKILKTNELQVQQTAYENIREKLMSQSFGPVGTEKKPNLKRSAADPLVSEEIQDEKNLKEDIEKAKKNPVVCQFSTTEADYTTEINDLSGVNVNIQGTSDNNPYNQDTIEI